MATVAGLYLALVQAPRDVYLGDVQRLFYLHVAVAWNGFLAFTVVLVGSALYLVTQDRRWDRLAYASGEVGVLFMTLVLVTGSLWARPVWNTWWTWDPRLTTSLILWFMYVGYLLIRSAAEGDARRARYAAVYGIVAFANVPVVHLSVTWWRSIHPLVVTEGQMNLDPRMVPAMVIVTLAFTLVYGWFLQQRARLEAVRETLAALCARAGEEAMSG